MLSWGLLWVPIVLLEFIQIVLFVWEQHSSAVRTEELARRMCLHGRLLVCPRRLRQGEAFKDKNEEDYIRYFEANCGIDDY